MKNDIPFIHEELFPHKLPVTHLLRNGYDVRTIQELLGHNSSKTTEIYTHVSKTNLSEIKSPGDLLNL